MRVFCLPLFEIQKVILLLIYLFILKHSVITIHIYFKIPFILDVFILY